MRRRKGSVLLLVASAFAYRHAAADCDANDPTDFVTPGVLVSFDISHRWAFGLGVEMSYSKWIACDRPIGPGAFINAVHYFAPLRGRFSAGAQGNVGAFGAEAGWNLTTASNRDYGLGPATGPIFGPFFSVGYYMVALRGSFASFGDRKAGSWTLDFGIKYPLGVAASGVQLIDLVPEMGHR